jgi:hypothetical protein
MDRNERIDEKLEREILACFNDTTEEPESFQIARLTHHASMVASAPRRPWFSLQWVLGGGVVLAVVLAITTGVPTTEQAHELNTDSAQVVVDDAVSRRRLDVGHATSRSLVPHQVVEAALTQGETLAYNTYFDMGFDDDDLDLGLIDGALDDISDDHLIQVYDRVLQDGG